MTVLDARAALRGFGARLTEGGEAVEVASFGEPSVEADALRGGAGVLPRPSRATWEASGTQALDYLHRMLTQDLRSLQPGTSRYALSLTREGRILADLLVVHGGERLLLDLDARAAVSAIPALERYVIADDVAFADRSEGWARLVLAGPSAPESVRRATGREPPAPGHLARLPLAGVETVVVRHDLGERPALHWFVEAERFGDALGALVRDGGAAPVGEEAWDRARVETGTPGYGAELDERVIPNEAGLDGAISWTKGCYLGQEPVVMARHRGHPPSLLCRLKIEGPPPPRDSELVAEGRRAGRLTTVVPDPALPGSLALGYVRWDSAKAGVSLSTAEGATAVVTTVLVERGASS
jgi:folate-binding protein YgfZ